MQKQFSCDGRLFNTHCLLHRWTAACRLEGTLFGQSRVGYRHPRSVDEDLYVLAYSQHLLVHRGAQATLLAMLVNGNVYVPERMMLEYGDDFNHMLSKNAVMVVRNGSFLPLA
ncbi:hypothetical protein EON64_02565 [archaeon]|nr:MAG: hypothetical protein EON64_02565 [archaeon]